MLQKIVSILNARGPIGLADSGVRKLRGGRMRHFGYVRAVGRRRAKAQLVDPLMSVPVEYTKKPLLRGSE